MALLNIKLELLFLSLLSIVLVLYIWNGSIFKQNAGLKPVESSMLDDSASDLYSDESNETECIPPDKIPKLLCWIMTTDTSKGREKMKAGLETWAKRCDKVLYVRNGSDIDVMEEIDGLLLVPMDHDGRDRLWRKANSAFRYIYYHYLEDYDWFMKADDDTYVIVERLKHFLMKHSNTEPIYFGHKYKPYTPQGYMSGGSGYAMSRQALKQLIEKTFWEEVKECNHPDAGHEDTTSGICLEAAGVQAGDTRDSEGRPTFLPLAPQWLLSQTKIDENFWYTQYQFYGPPKPGKDCCSDEPISFHYIEPDIMRLIDWLLYDVKKLNPSDGLCSDRFHEIGSSPGND